VGSAKALRRRLRDALKVVRHRALVSSGLPFRFARNIPMSRISAAVASDDDCSQW
jgi:hypothetical protein